MVTSLPAASYAGVFHQFRALEGATGALVMGINALDDSATATQLEQPALQCLAVGVEKLCKVTLGLLEQAETGVFPSDRKMYSTYRHNVQLLTMTLAHKIEQGAIERGDTYTLQLERTLTTDPDWPALVELLDKAGDAAAGRYVHEAALGGTPPSSDLPEHLWQDLQTRARQRLDESINEPEAGKRALLLVVMRWWHLVWRSWQHGHAGPTAQQYADQVIATWYLVPDHLIHAVKRI